MNISCGHVADRSRPGELLRLVADGLTDSGLEVRLPGRDGRCRLVIACAGAQCTVAVNDWGDAEWDYCPRSGENADPKHLADVATALLTGRADHFFVTDQGCLTWMRDYWDEAAASLSEPDLCGWITDPAAIAIAVVQAVMRAMSYLRPSRPT